MSEPKRLEGKRVTFTGRLASMARAEAVALVHTHGGTFDVSVTRRTSLLVVGQEGWPVRRDGRLTHKLLLARKLHARGLPIAILTEEEWLAQLGVHDHDGVHRRFTIAQLGQLLNVPRRRLEAWIRAGLVDPVETVDGVSYFDYQQMASVRALWEMTQAGVGLDRLQKSLTQLSRWFPKLEHAALPQSVLERNGQILVRLEQGLADPSGQLQFDFGDEGSAPEAATLAPPAPQEHSATTWLERGCALEEAGQHAEAAEAYRQALYVGGPNAQVCFNLGNVLYTLGQLGQAAERLRQAVELEHGFVEAWNNLGNVLAELGESAAAVAALRCALELTPDYADAHYNLADVLHTAGEFSEARRHWKEYLRLEPIGAWATYAKSRLRLGG